MSSRIEKMLAKSASIRGVKDIPEEDVVGQGKPKTAVGTMAAWQAAQQRIAELEASGPAATVPIDAVSVNPWQPRRIFDDGELQKLASSISEIGLIQPVVVRCVSNTDTQENCEGEGVSNTDTRYELVAGERRLRAHKLLGKADIKAVTIDVTDEDMASMALAENIDREDLTDYEIAIAIKNAENAFPNRKSLAQCLGIQRTELYQYLAFFYLPDFVLEDLNSTPAILGRNAAESIKTQITKHGDKALESLKSLWPRVKAGDLDQGKIAATIESAVVRGEAVKTNRDIKKLFVGKEQAGSITRDASHLAIKIRSVALTPEMETELRAFVERMFAGKLQ